MAKDIFSARALAWRLLLRNVSAQYRQAVLGILWVFIPPVISTALFVLLNSKRLFQVGETPIPYTVYVLVGTLLWQSFVDSLYMPLRQFYASTAMLDKFNFPREALLLSGFFEILLTLGVRIGLILVSFMWFEIPVRLSFLVSPLGIFLILLFGMTCGIFLVPLGLLFKDIEKGLGLVVTAWFFVTPVVYSVDQFNSNTQWVSWNPMAVFLNTTREWLTGQTITSFSEFGWAGLGTLLAFFLAWVAVRVSMPHLIQRLSA